MGSFNVIVLDPVKPNRAFIILAATFKLDPNTGNLIPLVQSDVQSISYTVYQLLDVFPDEITAGRQLTGSGSFVPSVVLSNSMYTGTAWNRSAQTGTAAGFNLTLNFPGNVIPYPGTNYEIQLTTIMASSVVYDDWFSLATLDVP